MGRCKLEVVIPIQDKMDMKGGHVDVGTGGGGVGGLGLSEPCRVIH